MVISHVIGLLTLASHAQALSVALADAPSGAWRPAPDYSTGTSNHKTMYLVDLVVGGEGATFRLLVDTGSPLLAVPGAHCSSSACAKHRRLSPNQGKLTGFTADIGYGMGSIKGRMLRDKVCLPSPDGNEALNSVGFGFLQLRVGNGCTEMSVLAADEESDDFASSSYDGILGLGLPDLDVFEGSCLMDRLKESGQISSTDFSLRLGTTGESELVLGGVDEGTLAGPGLLWVSLSPEAGSNWQISILDIAVDGKPMQIGPFDVLLDSGTSLISADLVVKNMFTRVAAPYGDCRSINKLPTITLLLSGDASLPFLPSDYVDRSRGECSLALMPGEFSGVNGQRMVLGDSFMRRYVTTFDRVNRRIGFGVDAADRFENQLLPNMFPGQSSRHSLATTSAPPDVKSTSDDQAQSETSQQQNNADTLSNTFPPQTSPAMVSDATSDTTLKYENSLSPALEPPNPKEEPLDILKPLPPPLTLGWRRGWRDSPQHMNLNGDGSAESTLGSLSPPLSTLRDSLPDFNSKDDGYARSTTSGTPNSQDAPLDAFAPSLSLSTLRASLPDSDSKDDDHSQSWTSEAPNQQKALSNMIRPTPSSLTASGAFSDVDSENDDYARLSTLSPSDPQEALSNMIQPSPPSWTASDASPTGGPPAAGDPLSDASSATVPTSWQTGLDIATKMKNTKNDLSLRNPYMIDLKNSLNLIQLHRVFAPKPVRRQIVVPLVRSQ